MLCRVAESVFWMSRYMERALAASRLVDVTLHLELDAGDTDDPFELWRPLLGPDYQARRDEAPITPEQVRYELAFDLRNADSAATCVRRAREAARGVRDSISSEMWEQLNTLYLWLASPDLRGSIEDDPPAFCRRVLEGVQFFQGLADCTLAHAEDWQFIHLGTYLERACGASRALTLLGHLLSATPTVPSSADEAVRLLAVLRSCGSAEAYARFYSLRVEPARVIEFLLLNPIFPQSVRFSLNAAHDALKGIAGERGGAGANAATRSLGLLRARLEYAAVDELLEGGLKPFLTDVQLRAAEVTDHVTQLYLRDDPLPGRLGAAERAAMIMAAQQQQQQQRWPRLAAVTA